MTSPGRNSAEDLRGASQLTVDAVIGVTNLVEAMHRTVTTAGGLLAGSEPDRMRGLAGLVYQNIRTITGVVGLGLDALLGRLAEQVEASVPSEGREAVLAALNGVLGDYLAATDNPLAIPMEFRRGGVPIQADDDAFRDALESADGRLLLLVHGSSCGDLQWRRDGHDHGEALARDLGYLPVYLRYNSGRHIFQNGRDLTSRLESLFDLLPGRPDLTMLAHSMGGLVCRSALHYAAEAGHRWPERLGKLLFLGTPHHGAPLERSGNGVDAILEATPYTRPFARLGKIRSAGITDLRYGNLLHHDCEGRDRFAWAGDERRHVPLPDDVKCYAMAARLGEKEDGLADRLVGDGLVPVDSALGRHQDDGRTLSVPESHRWVGSKMGHLDYLNDPDVYRVIKSWLAD